MRHLWIVLLLGCGSAGSLPGPSAPGPDPEPSARAACGARVRLRFAPPPGSRWITATAFTVRTGVPLVIETRGTTEVLRVQDEMTELATRIERSSLSIGGSLPRPVPDLSPVQHRTFDALGRPARGEAGAPDPAAFGVLPEAAVAIGDTWSATPELVTNEIRFTGEVTYRLEALEGGRAVIVGRGPVSAVGPEGVTIEGTSSTTSVVDVATGMTLEFALAIDATIDGTGETVPLAIEGRVSVARAD